LIRVILGYHLGYRRCQEEEGPIAAAGKSASMRIVPLDRWSVSVLVRWPTTILVRLDDQSSLELGRSSSLARPSTTKWIDPSVQAEVTDVSDTPGEYATSSQI
jgi:hypothetical protein